MPKKKKVPPFKILPVKMREFLGQLTGNELKVWLYLFLRTGEDLTSFPSNQTIANDLKIDRETVKTAKKGLRAKGWSLREFQRRREDGTLSTVVEKTVMPWQENTATDAEKSSHGTVAEKTVDGFLGQQKEYTVNPEGTASPHTGENLEEGRLACRSVSSSPTATRDLAEDQKQETQSPSPAEQNQNQDQERPKDKVDPFTFQVAHQIGCDARIPALLGIPYFHDAHLDDLMLMAAVLIHKSRSVHWLESLVVWMKEHKFWSKRLHTGDRGVKQLAKHLVNLELVEQFESHLFLRDRQAIGPGSAYFVPWWKFKQVIAEHGIGEEAKAVAVGGGFNLEDAQ